MHIVLASVRMLQKETAGRFRFIHALVPNCSLSDTVMQSRTYFSLYLHPPFLLITMHKAIKCRDESAVKRWLVEEGTEVNKCIVGRASHGHFFVGDGTALHWAAYYGQLEIAKLLLSNGAGICM